MRRSRADIVAAILEIARGGAIKTRIMYRGFLSNPQLKEYLDLLIDCGLVEYSNEMGQYHTTEKGLQFLRFYEDMGRQIAPKEKRATMTN